MLIIMIISSISLILACALFLILDTVQFKKLMANNLLLKATIVANNSNAAVGFNLKQSAEEVLRSLKDDEQIIGAVIYTPEGDIFATYISEEWIEGFEIPKLEEDGYTFGDNSLHLYTTIHDQDDYSKAIAKLYVCSDLSVYTNRLYNYMLIIGGVLGISLLVAFLLSSRFQRLISKPLLFLTRKAEEISVNKDYSIRIKKYTNDEVGGLIESFNEMLKEIEKQNVTLDEQLRMITETNTQITDSINYAKRIQDAILPNIDTLKSKLTELFIIFKPKDIVSGDFYWSREKDGYIYIAAVDCTGHGVPGSLMSMIGSNSLNGVINEDGAIDVDLVLSKLNVRVKRALGQNKEGSESQDGMDLAICRIDKKNKKVDYAGANREIYYYSKGEFLSIKADKYPIGGNQYESDLIFTKHTIEYNEGDAFYIFSDGFPDQFGGDNDKKFTNRRLREVLHEVYDKSMDDQEKLLDEAFLAWQADTEQTDDVLMIGFKP